MVETDNWDKLMDNHPALAKELVRAIVKGLKKNISANSVLCYIISKDLCKFVIKLNIITT